MKKNTTLYQDLNDLHQAWAAFKEEVLRYISSLSSPSTKRSASKANNIPEQHKNA